MRETLLDFLKALEAAIPPPKGCHHALTFAQYGSDADGWQDRLALQINDAGRFHCFFIDPGDFDKGIPELVSEIAHGVAHPPPNAQFGIGVGRYR